MNLVAQSQKAFKISSNKFHNSESDYKINGSISRSSMVLEEVAAIMVA